MLRISRTIESAEEDMEDAVLRSDGYLRLTCTRLEAQVSSWHHPASLLKLASRPHTHDPRQGVDGAIHAQVKELHLQLQVHGAAAQQAQAELRSAQAEHQQQAEEAQHRLAKKTAEVQTQLKLFT